MNLIDNDILKIERALIELRWTDADYDRIESLAYEYLPPGPHRDKAKVIKCDMDAKMKEILEELPEEERPYFIDCKSPVGWNQRRAKLEIYKIKKKPRSEEVKIKKIDDIPNNWVICKCIIIKYFIYKIDGIRLRTIPDRFTRNEYKDNAMRFEHTGRESNFFKRYIALNKTFYDKIEGAINKWPEMERIQSEQKINDLKKFCKTKQEFIAFYYKKFPITCNTVQQGS